MHKQLSLIFATLAMSTAAFGQVAVPPSGVQDWVYQIGYAANLNIGDSVLNLSNDGAQGGFLNATPFKTEGNICVNVYTFDPAEEEIACCACLVTPNGLNALSADADLISNPLTPAIPTSIVVKLIASEPGFDKTGAFTLCNPATVTTTAAANPYYASAAIEAGPPADPDAGFLVPFGMQSWGTTLEPAATPGTYAPVSVSYHNGAISLSELDALVTTCNFIQSDGTGFGICKSCTPGALAGAKK
jgi:hypothetical protein